MEIEEGGFQGIPLYPLEVLLNVPHGYIMALLVTYALLDFPAEKMCQFIHHVFFFNTFAVMVVYLKKSRLAQLVVLGLNSLFFLT